MKIFTNKLKNRNQTIFEELANSITHGLGLILSIFGLIFLLTTAMNESSIIKMVSYTIYGLSLIILYLMSTLYHSIYTVKLKKLFQQLDHIAIYLLIAGTYTPVILIGLRNSWAIYLLPIIWIMACIGIYMELKYKKLSITYFILMGWMAILVIKPLALTLPTEALILIITGGISYTIGIAFFNWTNLPFHHTIWHGFVLLGSISHFISIQYI
tara:strand:+ start:75 stop:713 length:639 start_codon:yes stop_codon:yes gene_type:complete